MASRKTIAQTVAIAQLGARGHYALPRILSNAGLLEVFYTDICASKGWPRLLTLLPSAFRTAGIKRLLGRVPYDVPLNRIEVFSWFGIEYAQRLRSAASPSEQTDVYLWATKRFNELVLGQGFNKAKLFYGFNAACETLLKAAKAHGLRTIMEQTSVPHLVELEILREEYRQARDWETREFCASSELFASKEHREWELADVIICGSSFVLQGVASDGGPVEKCVVVPYGIDSASFPARGTMRNHAKRPLNILFVGKVSLAKGIRHLYAALRKIDSKLVECRVVGASSINDKVLRRHTPCNVRLVGHIPRSDIRYEFAWADILVFPTLCDGFGFVLLEALSAGLPVIATSNSGAPNIIRDGVEGYIIPAGDADAIADRLERLIMDREQLARMSQAAHARSVCGSLEAYGERLLYALELRPAAA